MPTRHVLSEKWRSVLGFQRPCEYLAAWAWPVFEGTMPIVPIVPILGESSHASPS